MSLILLLIKYLPEIISVWFELVDLINEEKKKNDERLVTERAQQLKDEYFETLKKCKADGNTDALRDFIGRVRASAT